MIGFELFLDAIISTCNEIIEMLMPISLSERMSQRPLPFSFELKDIQDDIVASIGLTGEYNGTLSLYLPMQLGLKMAGWLMEEEYAEPNSDVYESVGEIINMIAGGLKNRLSPEDRDIFDLSIPIVISGTDKHIFHGKNMDILLVPIETDQGLFFVSLVLDKHADKHAGTL